ncbi:hypothetical protein [Bacillus andreraoultii]|uniref:hypothetical protein n=1 Tax=Bacillus andreraoultii TaxID=1499685 RepID=UPI00053A90FF|nr:hypothetical protein [Bacillus andreraoultii]
MNRTYSKAKKIGGWLLFILSLSFFGLQMGYLLFHGTYQLEYIDNRLFYVMNILIVGFLFSSILLLFQIDKKWKWGSFTILVIFIFVNIMLITTEDQKVKSVTSISPNFQHSFAIKENPMTNEAYYYRSYYGVFGRPKEKLPYQTTGLFNVKWITNDIATVTYKGKDKNLHQYNATFGDRSGGISYYYVGTEMHGVWEGDGVEVVSNTDGITILEDGKSEVFDWNHVVQFGTLAVVLTRSHQQDIPSDWTNERHTLNKETEAVWTIGLNEDFQVKSDGQQQGNRGSILLYKATMEDSTPIKLKPAQ